MNGSQRLFIFQPDLGSYYYVYASYIGQTKKTFMKQHSKVFARIADTKGKNVVFMIYQM